MLRAHEDQENLASVHQVIAATKQQGTTKTLQPKTPGAWFPKTPLKIPLNDENAACGLGGKSILGNKINGNRPQWITPAEPRTERPILGDKTTNTKARRQLMGKTPALSENEQSQIKPNTVSRPRPTAPKLDSSKLRILQETGSDPLSSEPDTNPPPPSSLPYESDVWPDGILKYDGIKPENRLKGYFEYYHNRRDESGMTRLDREMEAAKAMRHKDAENKIRIDMEEGFKWDLGLLESPKQRKVVPARDPEPVDKNIVRPGATRRVPSTIASRRAVSALGMSSKTSLTNLQRKPLAVKPDAATNAAKLPSFMQPTRSRPAVPVTATSRSRSTSTAGSAASRSTLGYSKGRSASSALQSGVEKGQELLRSKPQSKPQVLSRTASAASDATITPVSYAKTNAAPKPEFVSIFDVTPRDEDDDDAGMFGNNIDGGADALFDATEGGEDDFRLELGS